MDRFLEHSRIFYFENACQPEVFVSSADWMPRNFFRRIELVFPIEDGVLRERIISEILAISLADNTKARFLQSDGSYRRATLAKGGKCSRSQFDFMALASTEADAAPQAGGRQDQASPSSTGSVAVRSAEAKALIMDLYLLRHGIAVEPGSPGYAKDADRPLTPEGERKLGQIAEAMEALELSFDLILSSPYVRARQTAEIVAATLKARKTA